MKKFIAYFDYLGFKQFIANNDLEYQRRIIRYNFRDIESALGHGKTKKVPKGVVADLTNSKIKCINFSDTVVFWTNDDSETSLIEILEVAHKFNWQAILHFFPVRGSLVYGEIEYSDFKHENETGGLYNINSLIGKGLVLAYEKAEKQHWAGTVLDASFVNELVNRGYEIDTFLKPFAKKFKVPYKNGVEIPDEFVMRIIKGQLDEEIFKNHEIGIRKNFASYKKSIDSQDVKEKIENTINFLASFYNND